MLAGGATWRMERHMTDVTHWSDGTPIARRDIADPWGVVSSERWVRVMAEILAPGLWDVSGCARFPEDLPVSAELVSRIEHWQAWHDALDRRNTGVPHPHFWEQCAGMPIASFNAEGRAIARALKAELPPDWTVIAVDIDAWLRPDDPLEACELILRGTSP